MNFARPSGDSGSTHFDVFIGWVGDVDVDVDVGVAEIFANDDDNADDADDDAESGIGVVSNNSVGMFSCFGKPDVT